MKYLPILCQKPVLFGLVMALALLGGWGPAVAKTAEEESATFLEEARDFAADKEFRSAVIQLKNALRADPDNKDARFLLGEIYLQVGDGPSAEKELRSALDKGMTTSPVKLRLGQALLLQGKFQDVLEELDPDEFENDGMPDALVLVGRAQFSLRKFDDAKASFEKAEEIRPDGIQAKVGLARLAIESGQLSDAMMLIDRALEISPNFPNALLLKGEFMRLQRDLPAALGYFTAAVEQQPFNIVARLGRAATLIDLNRDDEALLDTEVVFEIIPKHPLAMYFVALTKTKKGDYVGANETLLDTGGALNKYLPSLYLKGVIHYGLENFEQARDELFEFLERNPGHIVARRLLGASLIRSGDHADALDVLEPLAELGSGDSRLNALLGAAYMGAGDYAKATGYFEKAAAAEPGQYAIKTQLALSKLAGGDSEGAIASLESVVDDNPESGQASVLLALVALRRGEFDRTLKVAGQLAERFPDNPLAANLMGAAHLGKGDAVAARRSFEKAVELQPDYFPAAVNLGQLDVKEGRKEDARTRYLAVVSQDKKYLGALYGLADLASSDGKRDEAEDWLEQAVSGNPDSATAGLRLVGFYLAGKENSKALSAASRLALEHGGNPSVLDALGKSQTVARQMDSAATTYRKLVELRSDSPMAHNLLGRAEAAASNLAAARDAFDRARELDPNFRQALEGLFALEILDGNLDAALELAEDLRVRAADSPVGDVLVGDVYMRMKRHDEAVAAYRAAKAKKSSGAVAVRLFQALSNKGEADAAFEELTAWVRANPDQKATRHILANALLQAARYAAAIVEYEVLEQSDQKNQPIILNNLAWLYQEAGDQKAMPTAERAVALAPNSAAVIDTLGWILMQRGDLERGLENLQKATALDPGEPEIRYHFVVALDRNGRADDALRELQALLAQGQPFTGIEEARSLLSRLSGN